MDGIVQILLYVGALQGLLLAVFLFSIRANKISNVLLGLLTLFWGFVLAQFALQSQGFFRDNPHFIKTGSQLIITFFPLLYLHVRYLLLKFKKFKKTDYLHFLPFFISILLYSDFYLSSGDEKIRLNLDPTPYYSTVLIFINEAIALQGIIYSVLSLSLLNSYKKEVKKYQSNIDKTIFKVLYAGILLSLTSWIIGTIGINLEYLGIELKTDLFVFVYLIFVVIIYIISYVALTTPEIFKVEDNRHEPEASYLSSLNSAKTNSLPTEAEDSNQHRGNQNKEPAPELLRLSETLEEYMEKYKPFLNPELSLQELSDNIKVTRHQLSSIINQVHGMNFYEYVNQHRVEEVKRLMEDPKHQHLKLISIAYDAGFNSKASFNRIFKQKTQMTPSQYFKHQMSA